MEGELIQLYSFEIKSILNLMFLTHFCNEFLDSDHEKLYLEKVFASDSDSNIIRVLTRN